MKTKKPRAQTDQEMHTQTMYLIKEVNGMILTLGERLNGHNAYSVKSRALTAKIMKEWAKSVEAGKTHSKHYTAENKKKYASLIKHLAEFIEE